MTVMIKLRLKSSSADLDKIRALPGAADLHFDERFGVVCLSPKDSLYAVRVEAVDNIEARRKASPEILEVYGEVRIGTFQQPQEKRGKTDA
jgi:hypothetical protein